jgi:hypothetical protein
MRASNWIVPILVVVASAGLAFAGGQPTNGGHQCTVIAGPMTPSTFPTTVGDNQRSVTWPPDYQKYWWNDLRERYERGSGWIDFNIAEGGWQYQPPGGGTPSAGGYAPHP